QHAAVTVEIPAVGIDEAGHRLERGETHRGSRFGQLAVDAERFDLVEAGEAEVHHQADPRGQRVVVGGQGAAFEAVDELGRVEAEHFGVAQAPDGSPAP